ncbi:MAG: phytoene desaturase [Bacteroidales bacterium]|nr:phytoene desaturase [Bacteroidales bacterium]
MDSNLNRKAVVIGAGIAGIASAIRLRAMGFDTVVFEKNPYPGGKLSELRREGFRFDRGPSLFTLPELVTGLFGLFGEDWRDHFSYQRLDNVCRYFFQDGKVLNAWSDPERFAAEAYAVTGEPSGHILRYLAAAERLYNLTSEVFIFSPFLKPAMLFRPEYLKVLVNLHRLDAFTSLHDRNMGSFIKNEMVCIFDRFATYNGSDPYRAPATLKMISHLEHNTGAFFPEGGMYRITGALYELAVRQGVSFRFNNQVCQVVTDSRGRATGVNAQDGFEPAGVVVSDADTGAIYGALLPEKLLKRPVRTGDLSSSAMIFYWAIGRRFPELDVHNILFSGDYRKEFRYLFSNGMIFDDPTIYIFVSSRQVPGDAPEGAENWFVMVNAPVDSGQDWTLMRERVRETVIRKINRFLATDIKSHIMFEDHLDPRGIMAQTSSLQGALYGLSSNGRLAAFRRHPNKRRRIPGLYFAGGSVHPGGGIPLCLSSAQIVASEIQEDLR